MPVAVFHQIFRLPTFVLMSFKSPTTKTTKDRESPDNFSISFTLVNVIHMSHNPSLKFDLNNYFVFLYNDNDNDDFF